MHDQGCHVTYLDSAGSQLGHKESLKDTARVLGRMFDGSEYRSFHQAVVQDIARFSHVSVWNGLTDEAHPTQVLADLLTMQAFGEKPLHERSFCYLGDARFNMGCSLLVGGTQMGMDLRICSPAALAPPAALVAQMRVLAISTGARITLATDPLLAVAGADFLYTDVWVSMGLLALQAAAYTAVEGYPLDVLDAESAGMLGYLLAQELANRLPATRAVATLLTRAEVDPHDPAFKQPSKPIRPVYSRAQADALGASRQWGMVADGDGWRRVAAASRCCPGPMGPVCRAWRR